MGKNELTRRNSHLFIAISRVLDLHFSERIKCMHIAERNANLPNRIRFNQQLPGIASDQRGCASHFLDVPSTSACRLTSEDEVSRAVPANRHLKMCARGKVTRRLEREGKCDRAAGVGLCVSEGPFLGFRLWAILHRGCKVATYILYVFSVSRLWCLVNAFTVGFLHRISSPWLEFALWSGENQLPHLLD